MKERINIVENQIAIDTEQLKKSIIDKWHSGDWYNFYYNHSNRRERLFELILSDLADYADAFSYETEGTAQKRLNLPGVSLDWEDKYPKSDIRSIGFEVLNLLAGAWCKAIEELTMDDIPMILEFLDTPPGKSLEAWEKWEKYWASLDYPARRKKLLES